MTTFYVTGYVVVSLAVGLSALTVFAASREAKARKQHEAKAASERADAAEAVAEAIEMIDAALVVDPFIRMRLQHRLRKAQALLERRP